DSIFASVPRLSHVLSRILSSTARAKSCSDGVLGIGGSCCLLKLLFQSGDGRFPDPQFVGNVADAHIVFQHRLDPSEVQIVDFTERPNSRAIVDFKFGLELGFALSPKTPRAFSRWTSKRAPSDGS